MGGDPPVGQQHYWRVGVVSNDEPVVTVVTTLHDEGTVQGDLDMCRVQLRDSGIMGIEVHMRFGAPLRVAQIAKSHFETWEPAMKL